MSVQTKEKNIKEIFSGTPYYIDFYQREYKWKRSHVKDLLDDVFHRFEADYDPKLDATEATIDSKYQWYYMNSYMTNNYKGKIYIVDGQQRLTTLTLILIKLIHLSKKIGPTIITKVLEDKVYGADISGNTYWMGQSGRDKVLEDLLSNRVSSTSPSNITEINMYGNYNEISGYLDDKLKNSHIFQCFIVYFLKKILLVNIHIIDTTDVPMVFEVINDRGEKLRPYEVFKGQLFGQLDKDEIEQIYNPLWKQSIEPLEARGDEQSDSFFRYYFRAKYVNTENEHRQFDGEYHKTIFSSDWNLQIKLKKNPHGVKSFVSKNLTYYSQLYAKLIDEDVYDRIYGEYVYYNYLNEQDRQYMLIMSTCVQNDLEEHDKIRLVSRVLDRHYVLLQLYGCYDSNSFTEILLDLNKSIRDMPLKDIHLVFDKHLIDDINRRKSVSITNPFDYKLFKDAGSSLGIRFIRYFFARIENFIATGVNPSHKLTKQQYWDLVRNTGAKQGYHVEHILANNDENRNLFGNDEEFFQRERNRLGALLLLKGKDNISSGNETFLDKLKTYNNADISNRWNRSLIDSFYHTNKDFSNFTTKNSLNFKPYSVFDANAVEERHRLLFDMVKLIWT